MAGIVNPAKYLHEQHLEMITTDGVLETPSYREVKAVCFVSDEMKTNLFSEDNLFERRPKLAGLWARFSFRDGDRLEGILSHNLMDWPGQGFWITPPKAGPGRQRVFLPRFALESTELRGVVGLSAKGSRRKDKPSTPVDVNQMSIFDT